MRHSKLKLCVTAAVGALLLFLAPDPARGATAGDCLALLTQKIVKQMATADADKVFRIAASGGQASDGLAAALRARPDDAGVHLTNILFYFDEAVAKQTFEQISLVKHAGGLDELVVNLGRSQGDAATSSALLRYVTTKMSPTDVARFEFPVGARVADVLDTAGNLMEFKALDWSRYNSFTLRFELLKVRDQAVVFQQYAAANGKTLTLLFDQPCPPALQQTFTDILGPLTSQPNVSVVMGY